MSEYVIWDSERGTL